MIDIHIKEKAFEQKCIIKDLRFTVESGELVVLFGPSGAGKSTLLNLIAGLDTAFVGSVKLNHIEQRDSDFQQHDPHSVGLMFQEARLMPWLSALENVALVAKPSQENAKRRASQLLQDVGLGDYLHAFPNQLSGGMCKRVALARAFMYAPPLLMMDEPFSSLDAPSAHQLRQQLLALQTDNNNAVLYVTHDLKEAVTIADRILFLSHHPMQIIGAEEINLDKPRDINSSAVNDLCIQLHARYPVLVTG